MVGDAGERRVPAVLKPRRPCRAASSGSRAPAGARARASRRRTPSPPESRSRSSDGVQPIDPRQPARDRVPQRVEDRADRRREPSSIAPAAPVEISAAAMPGRKRAQAPHPTGGRGASAGARPRAGSTAGRPGTAAAPPRPEPRRPRRSPGPCRRRSGRPPLERLLELAVAVARPEQDGDVGRLTLAGERPVVRSRTVATCRAAGRSRPRRARRRPSRSRRR